MLQKIIEEVTLRLDKALRQADDTRAVVIGDGILSQTIDCFRKHFNETDIALIADRNTFRVAGRDLLELLRSDEQLTVGEPFIFEEDDFHTDAANIERVRTFLSSRGAIPIAVGSGTINDIVKRAAFECHRQYMIVGTAASMDGYTAFGSSADVDGFKQTLSCLAPKVVLIDLDVLSQAPATMGAAGYADLLAKIPAGADWMLADLVGTEPIHREAWALVQDHLRDWLANPTGIVEGDKVSLCRLIEGLIMSGLAMQMAKTSRTASGAEHMFGHLWDNQHHTFQGRTPSHGFKVGIGSVATSMLYELVFTLTEDDFRSALQKVEEFHHSWHSIESRIRDIFGNTGLAKQVTEQSRQKYVDAAEIRCRINMYLENWQGIRDRLNNQVLPVQEIRKMLRDAGAPSHPKEIGIDQDRFLQSFEQTQLIRCRYNVLDFVMETGQWQRFKALIQKNFP